jgi:hypothetical protein
MIRGKRNFLSSCPLHLGFGDFWQIILIKLILTENLSGLMFRLDDESVARHRQNKALELKEGKNVVAEPESETVTVAEDEEEAEIEEEDEEEVEGEEAEEEEFPDVQVSQWANNFLEKQNLSMKFFSGPPHRFTGFPSKYGGADKCKFRGWNRSWRGGGVQHGSETRR